jgi:serine/threonine-protein kinase
MIDALLGLHAAHELRDLDGTLLDLVHRDVSPQNILVGVDGVSRITDFGVAFAAARTTATGDGRVKGKFSYMAPEQLRNEEVDHRLDVFSAGVVLWEALACRPLFRCKDDIATINAVLASEVAAPSSIIPAIPAALDAVVLKALERDPAKRYQSAAEFADALEQLPIEIATTRAVAAHVEDALGHMLAERRALIREASGAGQHGFGGPPIRSDVHQSPFRAGEDNSLRDEEQTTVAEVDFMDAPTQFVPPAAAAGAAAEPKLAPEPIEHRRMRGLLAAAMLLLVGSALGLLLARSSRDPTPAPAPASVAPPDR